tara:strand:+ start:450 stop:1061 length:612 start_codon:yes stop_codon:yes gene_type:complete
MAFYTQGFDSGTKDPKRKFRWKVSINNINGTGTDCVWWAKSVTKPNYEISESEHTFLTHKFYYPGRVTWGEVEMTLVDPVSPGAVAQLNAIIRAQGYIIPDSKLEGASLETMSKGKGSDALGTIHIHQLDAEGNAIETWELKNPWLKGVKYGDLAYDGDELLEISLNLRYDWATCKIGDDVPGATESAPDINGPDKDFFEPGK